MSPDLEYREKDKVGDRPAKLNEKKSDRQLEREIKDKGDIFSLLEEQHGNFVAAIKVKMSGSEKKNEQEQVRHFLHKTSNQEGSGSFTL